MVTVTARAVSLAVTFAGNSLTGSTGFPAEPSGTTGIVISARGQSAADTGWPTCSVFVTAKPVTGNEEDDLSVTAGAGNNVTRFTGVLRQFRSSAFPKGVELVCMGTLAYAAEWAPETDMAYDSGGSAWVEFDPEVDDVVAFFGVTDQVLIRGILDQVPNVTYTSGNIGGTGITLGDEAPEAFVWRAGTSAWNQIQAIDRATLYRTYQDASGTIRRGQMVGHPTGTPSFTLADADALEGAAGTRDTIRTRNNVKVRGHDYGDGFGPVEAIRTATPITGTPDRTEVFESDMIESGEDPPGTPDGRGGLQAGDIADGVQSDVDKEFVDATVPTWRDDTAAPGQTITLSMLNRLLIGEDMWIAGYAWEVADGWRATFTLQGGG